MTWPFCFSFHSFHYVTGKTTSGIYSTNIYSAVTICQKLGIKLLTKTLWFLTSRSSWSGESKMVTYIFPKTCPDCRETYLYIWVLFLPSPKHPRLYDGIEASKLRIFLLFCWIILIIDKYISDSIVRDFSGLPISRKRSFHYLVCHACCSLSLLCKQLVISSSFLESFAHLKSRNTSLNLTPILSHSFHFKNISYEFRNSLCILYNFDTFK